MKYNLRNKPIIQVLPLEQQEQLDEYDVADYPRFYDECLEWFEGFEKELTQKLSDAEFSETKSIKNDVIIEVIKEILGEK